MISYKLEKHIKNTGSKLENEWVLWNYINDAAALGPRRGCIAPSHSRVTDHPICSFETVGGLERLFESYNFEANRKISCLKRSARVHKETGAWSKSHLIIGCGPTVNHLAVFKICLENIVKGTFAKNLTDGQNIIGLHYCVSLRPSNNADIFIFFKNKTESFDHKMINGEVQMNLSDYNSDPCSYYFVKVPKVIYFQPNDRELDDDNCTTMEEFWRNTERRSSLRDFGEMRYQRNSPWSYTDIKPLNQTGFVNHFGNPAANSPIGINPMGISPIGINPMGINPMGINSMGINPINPIEEVRIKASITKSQTTGTRQSFREKWNEPSIA